MKSENKRFTINLDDECIDDVKEELFIDFNDKIDFNKLCDVLNELNNEKDWLEMNNKDLVSFIKSKGYTLKDFLKYVGQFSSVGVNKEDWND